MMPNHPLSVAIVWHMHQPFYRDLRTGQIPLPWVRLHAAKDYLHMAEALARHPAMHVTINMVPSLTEQILAWAEGREADDLALLAEQETWSPADKRAILGLCFSISWDKIIRRYGRYAQLLERRPQALADPDAFSDADYRDLLAWFNLAWIDPNRLQRDLTLAALVAKGRDFTLADLRAIHAIQRQIASAVLPSYRALAETGQLEICASPYFHPILPLLANSDSAQRPSPGLPVPQPPFRAAEDVAAQLRLAVEAHTAHFGAPPQGLWPSEGAVSPEILPLIRAAGFTWLATGEAILGRSLGRTLQRDGNNLLTDPRALYQPYRVMADTELGPYVIFRDHELSDRIGFLYQGLPGRQAAEDMIYRLLEIRRRINDPDRPYLVSIILDGENCWEHYEHNGDVFLDALYGGLSRQPELKPVTVSEFLAGRRPAATLAKLATGSWIGGDLTTWIGDPEHNRAWDALRRTREHLVTRGARHVTPTLAPERSAGASVLNGSIAQSQSQRMASEASPGGEPGRDSSLPTVAQNDKGAREHLVDKGARRVMWSGSAAQSPLRHATSEASLRRNSERDSSLPTVAQNDVGARQPDFACAWRALYAAEGSDWFWWYSHRNSSQQDALFDRLFRHNLAAAYEALGDEAPADLAHPISQPPAPGGVQPATGFVSPRLTGAPYPGEAWAAAAAFTPATASSGTMQRAEGLIERLFAGHDARTLYLRLDLRGRLADYDIAIYLGCAHVTPINQRPRDRYPDPNQVPASLTLCCQIALAHDQQAPFLYRAAGQEAWAAGAPVASARGERVLEVAVPLNVLGLRLGDSPCVLATVAQGGIIVAQVPERCMADMPLTSFR